MSLLLLGMSYKPNLSATHLSVAAAAAAAAVATAAAPIGQAVYKRHAVLPAMSVYVFEADGRRAAGNIHSPSTSMAGLGQYRQLVNDYGPPSLGYTQGVQGTNSNQVPQSKYAELLAIIEELGKEIRPTYAGSKSAMERLKRGIIHARGLVRECLAETERNARS